MSAHVAVVGSANLDIVLAVTARPEAGETLSGTGMSEIVGGKGLNQALAAARITRSSFVAEVGEDSAARRLIAALLANGVDTRHVQKGAVPSGRAFITVTPDGENSIIVMAMANAQLDARRVTSALDDLQPTVVLTQLETPPSVTAACAVWCNANNARFILNPSPVAMISPDIVAQADPLIVNQSEAQSVVGTTSNDWMELALDLATRARSVVLTLGANGALVAEAGEVHHIQGGQVHAVVDTTGAGDAFAGALAAHLGTGKLLRRAAELANAEAARLIQLNRSDR